MGIHKSGVTMKHCRLLLLSLYLSLPSVLLRCPPPCPPGTGFLRTNNPCTICKIVVSADCTSKETVRGYCGCPVCAKAEGETCGGMGGLWGNVRVSSLVNVNIANRQLTSPYHFGKDSLL